MLAKLDHKEQEGVAVCCSMVDSVKQVALITDASYNVDTVRSVA
jgi:hypothetical protein